MLRTLIILVCGSLLLVPGSAQAVIANAWHIPSATQTGIPSTMRDAYVETSPTGSITVYSGFFKDNGNGGDQNGGTLYYRNLTTAGAWQSVGLGFHADVPSTGPVQNQFWKATINLGSGGLNAGPNDVVAYYFKLTFAANSRDTTYLYGGDIDGNHRSTGTESIAQASPYTFRNRPAWVYHAGNRVVSGDSVSFWSKVGYIGDVNNNTTRWANAGAVYYTKDGTTPAGSLGTGTGTTTAVPATFDHTESPATSITGGKAMWWVAQVPTLLQGLPVGATIKYKVGFWHTANNEERFADFNAGTGDKVFTFTNGVIGDPVLTISSASTGTLNGNYTTTKLFADEIAGTSIPLTIAFAPGQPNITEVEVVTNLNQRDNVTGDMNSNAIDDGMEYNQTEGIIGTASNYYYRKYAMTSAGAGNYAVTLNASKTGAYRLTARWKVTGDSAWRWFTNVAANRRDHAIVVSPINARNMNMYEVNTLTVEASASGSFVDRSTFEDLYDAQGARHTADGRGFNLDYLSGLGVNMLWFQPVHPAAILGREVDPATSSIYTHGSPYAVKNFFEIDPWMSAAYNGSDEINSESSRSKGLASFQGFAEAADNRGIGIMLDAPFNHTGYDAEVGQPGIDLLQRAGETWAAGDLIKDREARFFSKTGDYAQRASNSTDIAIAPDRGDFGKWGDVKDVYFGRYSALVNQNPADNSNHLNESDQFLYTDPNFTSDDDASPARNANVTRQVWKYFARYATWWLEKTRLAGQNRNSQPGDGNAAARYAWDARGIDGLRCDFGQGLPPQCWEYIINVARSYKWSFVMMSESLDGGAVTYRSNRHFDVLNENIVFPLKSAGNASQFRQIYEGRRSDYGQGLVLANTTSHDEENYDNIFHPLLRHYVTNSLDGAPLIFMGQELGITRLSGFTFYETNFGKQIAHFKKFNSMQPGWINRNTNAFGEARLFDAFASAAQARLVSPALRSSNRYFLNRTAGGAREEIWSVAKYEQPNVSPNFQDVVFAFANLRTETGNTDTFNVNITQSGSNLFGIKSGRTYNVKNLAAYIGPAGQGYDQTRRSTWLWGSGTSGSTLLSSGILVILNGVPSTNAGWLSAPFEAQYLKLYDVTPPPTPAAPGTIKAYVIGNQVTFSWSGVSDPDGGISGYRLIVGTTPGGSDVFSGAVGNVTCAQINGTNGQILYARLVAINNAGIESTGSAASSSVALLSAAGDEDHDGMNNSDEDTAGTDPFNQSSALKITQLAPAAGPNSFTVTWQSVAGKSYRVQSSPDLANTFTDISPDVQAASATSTWTDSAASGARKFYRVRLLP